MNTRAIIAYRIPGGFFSLWCWFDGEALKLGDILRTYFTTDDDVKELLYYKSILGIVRNPSDIKDPVMASKYFPLRNGCWVRIDDGYDKSVVGSTNGFVKSIDEFLAEDISFLYVYDWGNWTVYKKD